MSIVLKKNSKPFSESCSQSTFRALALFDSILSKSHSYNTQRSQKRIGEMLLHNDNARSRKENRSPYPPPSSFHLGQIWVVAISDRFHKVGVFESGELVIDYVGSRCEQISTNGLEFVFRKNGKHVGLVYMAKEHVHIHDVCNTIFIFYKFSH